MQVYTPVSQILRARFGEKVYKVPVGLADTCPNREGLKGMQTCIFCDEWGSAARKEILELEISDQIETVKNQIRARYRAHKFLIYFQAYTNTFMRIKKLEMAFETALSKSDVVGLIVGTRPDCISKALLDMWHEYSKKTFVSVELGVQTFDNGQLEWMRRGHTREQSLEAIRKISHSGLDLGIHLMLGLPGETDEQVIETAKLISDLPIQRVKLHNLHVLKDTPLADLYAEGKFTPIDLEAYVRRVTLFLRHLRPEIAIDRLAAVASRWDELIAPDWTRFRMVPHQRIVDAMTQENATQGDLWGPRSDAPRRTDPTGLRGASLEQEVMLSLS